MKKLVYPFLLAWLSFIALPHAANAQVKMGANPGTIGPNSGLEVEATSGSKVIVDKATGSVVIQNTPTSTTNTSILTVDANGLVSKQVQSAAALPVVFGSLSPTGRTISPAVPIQANFLGTGASITLPANSKYIVHLIHTLRASGVTNTTGTGLVRASLSDSNADGAAFSTDVIGPVVSLGTISVAALNGILTGTFIVNNTSALPKTYHLKVVLDANTSPAGGNSYNLPAGYTLFGVGGPSEGGFYAVPVN